MSKDYDAVESLVGEFLAAKGGASFAGEELFEFLRERAPKAKPSKGKGSKGGKTKRAAPGRELGEMALNILNSLDEPMMADQASGRFQCASGFFKGVLFRATPTRREIEAGILLPFHRLAFFCSPESCGAEEALLTATDLPGFGRVRSVRRELPLEELQDSHVLLGRDALVDYLVAEDQANFEALRSSSGTKAMMRLSVFDMDAYYKASGFQEGDSLIFEVLDYATGAFAFRRESGRASEAAREAWLRAFELAIAATWRDYGEYLEVYEQVGAAFFSDACSGGFLAKRPDLGLDEATRLFKDVALVQNAGEWNLVPSEELSEEAARDYFGKDELAKGLSPDDLAISKGSSDLEDMLKEVGFPYPMPIFQAIVTDEIANGCESFGDFHARHLAGLKLKFADDAQEAAFLNFVEELWEVSFEDFNPALDEAKAPLRTRALELASSCSETLSAILSRIEADPDGKAGVLELYKSQHASVASLQRDIIETLAFLNSDAPAPEEGSDYDDFEMRLGDMEELWDSVQEALAPISGKG